MMKRFEANITHRVANFLHDNLKNVSLEKANQKMHDAFGIVHFFDNSEELETLTGTLSEINNIVEDTDRVEYGDFQTNQDLANKAASTETLNSFLLLMQCFSMDEIL